MKKYALLRYCLVFLAIVLPYFTAAAFHGTEMVLAERKPDMEEYLPILVFSQISPDMKKETIKAQTVIARSNIQRRIGAVSYTHLRAHETREDLVCRLLLEKKK